MISILLLTWNRGDITPEVLRDNLMRMTSGEDVEFLVCDQGSTDPGLLQLLDKIRMHEAGQASLEEFVHANVVRTHVRRNSINEGVGRSLNQLFLRSTGDVVMIMGNDLRMPPAWDREMLDYVRGVPNSGIIGMDWGHSGTPPVSTSKDGYIARWLTPKLDRVFGNMMLRRQVIDEIGLFHEGFHPYGFEDSDFNARVNLAGFRSCYVPSMKCEHVGTGKYDDGEYRAAKDLSMRQNMNLLGERLNGYAKTGLREPLPPKRDPL